MRGFCCLQKGNTTPIRRPPDMLPNAMGESLKNQTCAASRIELTDGSVFGTTWSLIDPTYLILKLDSFKELTAN